MNMSNYAVVDLATNTVVSMVVWDGNPGWSPDEGQIAIESDTASIGWLYVEGELVAPPPPPVTPPTLEEITAANTAFQSMLIYQASQAMAPVLVSLQLGDATDDETVIAKEWQAYYRALKLVDVSAVNPDWPRAPGV
jgi:hypothetical protein